MKEETCTHETCTQRTNAFTNGCKRFRDVKDCGRRFDVVKDEKLPKLKVAK